MINVELTPPQHGGDLGTWQRHTPAAAQWLDLSSACNREPWPIPEFEARLWYELPDTTALMHTAETYFSHKPLAIGAGTQQLIEVLPPLLQAQGAGQRVAVPAIGYQEHAYCWRKWGYEVYEYHRFDELLSSDWDIAVVISPNNPTGETLTDDESQTLRQRLQSSSRYLVVDEAFLDATPETSWLGQVLPRGCLVLRSVGKFFGLAGARVGFLFGDQTLQTPLRAMLGPWPVATPALHLVATALQDSAWQADALASLAERHTYFTSSIVPKLNTVFDSQTMRCTPLFYTWTVSTEQGSKAFQALHSVGIHIRLGEGWVRVSLPAGHEMQRLNNALVRLLQGYQLKELG